MATPAADADQQTLRRLWKEARGGTLTPWSEAKVWALREAWREMHGCYSYAVWLWKVRMVVTIDMMAKWDGGEQWIKENCVEVMLDGPCWIQM